MSNKYFLSIFLVFAFFVSGQSQCLEETHTPFEGDSWISCETSTNPNPIRPASHWIMYDLGYEYILDSVYIWNLNTWSRSEAGIKDAVIDYSLDGINWISLDTFFVEKASASYKYEGTIGPRFNETPARYVLLTALSNWGDATCTGLSEMKFQINGTVSTKPELANVDAYMEVSPNPVSTVANISFKSDVLPESVALYDLSGRLIEEKTTINSKNIMFRVGRLMDGIYFVKARVGDTVLTEKIVKVN